MNPISGQEEMKRKARVRRGRRSGGLLDSDKPKIIFTNPDILFLILGLQYHAEPFEALRRYETLILDEFHLDQEVELAHALAMVALARGFGIFRWLVLLSATPHPQVRLLLDRAKAELKGTRFARTREEGFRQCMMLSTTGLRWLQDSIRQAYNKGSTLRPRPEGSPRRAM